MNNFIKQKAPTKFMKGELRSLVEKLILRYGSLRSAEKQTKISHSGLAQIRDGQTLSPKPATLQKLAAALASLEPPLLDEAGKPIRPTWIELQILAEENKQQGEEDQQAMLTKVEALEKELAQLRSKLGVSVA
jgi:hypothetical protein